MLSLLFALVEPFLFYSVICILDLSENRVGKWRPLSEKLIREALMPVHR